MPSNWYYAAGNRQVGPVSEAELDALVASGTIRNHTLVWHEGLANWIAYESARPESPASAVSAPPLPSPVGEGDASEVTRFCTQCGRATPERELAVFGNRLVCANCKPTFTHELRERGVTTGHFRYAGFWIRYLARLIDAVLLYIVILPVTFLLVGSGAFSVSPEDFSGRIWAAQGMLMLFNMALAAGYEVWFLAHYAATPGKLAVGRKVISADGTPLTYKRALARHLATYVSSFTLGIGYIMAAFDVEKRALHDRICDTRVISK